MSFSISSINVILQSPKMKSSIANPPQHQRSSYINYRKEETKMNSLETFIELIEKDIFNPDNYRRIRNNISEEEKEALRNIQNDPSRTYRT